MPAIGTLTDSFGGPVLDPKWVGNGAGVVDGQLYVNAHHNAGVPIYSYARTTAQDYTWSGSALSFYGVVMPGEAGDVANAQFWMLDPAGVVDRLGFEYRAEANELDLIGQTGGNYAPIGATVTLGYDPTAHRCLRIAHTGSSIVWSTSPDGLTWTVRRTLTGPPAWTTKTMLQPAVEGFRSSGVNDTVRVGAVNLAPPALPVDAPVGADALQRRTLAELRTWRQWLTANNARGWVGEFGWVTLFSRYNDPDQGEQWEALAEAYLTDADVAGLSATAWSSGREFDAGYPLGLHVGQAVNAPLSIANTDGAAVIAAHGTRGTGTNTRWRGVNLAGHETGVTISGGGTVRSAVPLMHTPADFGFLAANGVDLVRLPLAWERLQPTLGAALDPAALTVLDGMLSAARQVGIRIVIDLHNYARYTRADGTVVALGGALTNAQLSDFWTRLSAWVRANQTRSGVVVGYGLMNEPHALVGGASGWEQTSQAAVTAIRNAGDTRLLLVAGYQFSSLTDWTLNHAGGWITDPAANFAYEAHHYWDTRSALGSRSGTYQQSPTGPILTYTQELDAALATETAAPAIRETVVDDGQADTATNATVTTSPAVRAGDVLVAFHAVDFGPIGSTPPTGTAGTWTRRITADRGNAGHLTVWTRPVTASGAQTVTVASAASTDNVLRVVVLDGATLASDWFVAAAAGNGAGALAHLTPSVAASGVNDRLLMATAGMGQTAYTAPAGAVELGNEVASRTYVTLGAFAETRAISGATGTRSVASAASLPYVAVAIVVHGAPTRTVTYLDVPVVDARTAVNRLELIATGRTLDTAPASLGVVVDRLRLDRHVRAAAVAATVAVRALRFERTIDLDPLLIAVHLPALQVTNLTITPIRVRVGVLSPDVVFRQVTPLTERRVPVVVVPRLGLRFLAQEVLTRRWLSWDLGLREPEITWNLSKPTEITGRLAARELVEHGLDEWAVFIHAEQNGIIRASGILQPWSPGGEEVEISASGVGRYPVGIPYQGTFTLGNPLGVAVDPLDVVRHIWTHLQSYPEGHLGVVVSPTKSPVKRGTPARDVNFETSAGEDVSFQAGPYLLHWYEDTDCGAEIDSLAADTPFDWVEAPTWNATRDDVVQRIELGYPRLGRDRPDLAFVEGENLTQALTPVENDDAAASEVIVLGKGEGSARVRGRASARLGRRTRRAVVVEAKDVESQVRADAFAAAELRRREPTLSFDECSLLAGHPNAPFGSFGVGDDIPVRAEVAGYGRVVLRHRVVAYSYRPDAADLMVKTARSDSFTYGGAP